MAPVDRTDPSLEVLVEQRREADREVTALLAAQQTVMGFSRSRTPAQAARWLDTPTAEPELVARILLDTSTSQGASLARKRRLPDGAGYQSTWRIGAPDTSGLLIEVSDRSGEPKIDWAALRRQVEKLPAAVAASTNGSGE